MNTTPLEPPEPADAQPTEPQPTEPRPTEPKPPEPKPPEPHAVDADPAPDKRSGASTGTIVWGVLILAFCAVVLQQSLAPGTVDPGLWVTGVVLGLGALLLVVAVAVILRGRR